VQPPYEAADPRETIHQTPETFLPDDGDWDELFELFSTEHDNLLESIPSLPDIQPHHSPLGQVFGGGLSALFSNHNSETGITTRIQRPDADIS